MAYIRKKIDTYEATVGSWGVHLLDGAPYRQTAAIVVEADDGNQYNLYFTANEVLPSNTIEESAGVYLVFFPAASFHPMVELLREEEPMYVHYRDDASWLRLSTDEEPVGEAELLARP